MANQVHDAGIEPPRWARWVFHLLVLTFIVLMVQRHTTAAVISYALVLVVFPVVMFNAVLPRLLDRLLPRLGHA